MKNSKMLSYFFAAAGVVLAFCSFIGRFVDNREVFGKILPGGMSASSVMIGADTFLLLAVLAFLYKKD
jgi:hypothetical protein